MTSSLGKYHNIWEKSPSWIQNDRPKSHFAHRLSWINEILLEVVLSQVGHDKIRKLSKSRQLGSKMAAPKTQFPNH